MVRRSLLALTIALAITSLVGCSDRWAEATADRDARSPASLGYTTVATQDPSTTPGEVVASGETVTPDDTPIEDLCVDLVARDGITVTGGLVVEASGLAASSTHPGVLWTHNDSGDEATVYAIAPDGAATAFTLGVAATDIEDLALVDGMLYLADIGDNDSVRSEVTIHRFAEPDPTTPGTIEAVESVTMRYPKGAVDAEALIVDPRSGDLLIIEKAFRFGTGDTLLEPAEARIFSIASPFGSGADEVITLSQVGRVQLDELTIDATGEGPADAIYTRLGVGGVATGADITADGDVVAIRTYETLWLFARLPGQSVADALTGEACEAPTVTEEQGEAVAFLPGDRPTLVTLSEGLDPTVHVISP